MATITVIISEVSLRREIAKHPLPPTGWVGSYVTFIVMRVYTPFADLTGRVHTNWHYEPLIDCHVFSFTLNQ